MALRHVIGLDHVVVAVRDLDAAAAAWGRLGFTVSPRGTHSAHMGSGNYTIMLGPDYIELLGVLTPTPHNAPMRAFLEGREGLERAAFTTDDAAAGAEELRARGIAGDRPHPLRPPVTRPDGQPAEARFNVFQWPAEERPGGLRIFACEHLTRENVWIPELQSHANAVSSILRLEVLTHDRRMPPCTWRGCSTATWCRRRTARSACRRARAARTSSSSTAPCCGSGTRTCRWTACRRRARRPRARHGRPGGDGAGAQCRTGAPLAVPPAPPTGSCCCSCRPETLFLRAARPLTAREARAHAAPQQHPPRPEMNLTRRAALATSAAIASSVLRPERAFAQETPRRGGVMTVHFATEQRILNPSLQASTGVYIVGGKMQEPLVDLDAQGQPTPCLAESWEAAPDGRTITFRLRRNVTWHDGRPFTSADVQFTAMEMWKKILNYGTALQLFLTEVQTPDAHTAVFKYERPMPLNLLLRALPDLGYVSPKHVYEGSTSGRTRPTPRRSAPGPTGSCSTSAASSSSPSAIRTTGGTACPTWTGWSGAWCPTAPPPRRRWRRGRSCSAPIPRSPSPTCSASAAIRASR
jgi:catechol 2,3-dioxygenase-like lactoylglutathione lyase family enzyme